MTARRNFVPVRPGSDIDEIDALIDCVPKDVMEAASEALKALEAEFPLKTPHRAGRAKRRGA